MFCVLFAINSAIHSYLIVKYSDGDKIAMSVGFYYMSNSVGRCAALAPCACHLPRPVHLQLPPGWFLGPLSVYISQSYARV